MSISSIFIAISVSIYSSDPIIITKDNLKGYDVTCDGAELLWENDSASIGCTYKESFKYDADEVQFIASFRFSPYGYKEKAVNSYTQPAWSTGEYLTGQSARILNSVMNIMKTRTDIGDPTKISNCQSKKELTIGSEWTQLDTNNNISTYFKIRTVSGEKEFVLRQDFRNPVSAYFGSGSTEARSVLSYYKRQHLYNGQYLTIRKFKQLCNGNMSPISETYAHQVIPESLDETIWESLYSPQKTTQRKRK